MIVPIARSSRTSEENVLPLINIVFLLLIFFMIAGALSATTPFPLDPPRADAAAEAEPPHAGLAIGADGELALAGRRIHLDELAAHARQWRTGAEAGAVLTVQVDAAAASEDLLAVIEQLRRADIERIRLLAVGGPEAE